MTPVEKVAEAICLWDGGEWYGYLGSRECSRNRYRDMARAAFAILRDPELRAVAHTADKLGMDATKVAAVWMMMVDGMLE